MPKRTNSFQKLITVIEKSISDEKTDVKESEFIKDNLGINREIDVLITTEINNTKIQIALECRDHGRDQSLEWIDQIIGKYFNINIEKVVAVSSSGFSDAAVTKAKAYNISLLSLEDVSQVDWSKLINDLKLTLFKFELRMCGWKLGVKDELIDSKKLDQDTNIFNSENNIVGTIKSELDSNYEERGRDYIFENIHNSLPNAFGDNEEKKTNIELSIEPKQSRYIKNEDDEYIQILSFIMYVKINITFYKTEQNYFEYKNVPVIQVKAKVDGKEKRGYGTLNQTSKGYGIRIFKENKKWETYK